MSPHDSDNARKDEAVPAYLPPAEGPRPDWLLDAAVDPMEEQHAPAIDPPRLLSPVPPTPGAGARTPGPPARPTPPPPAERIDTTPAMPTAEIMDAAPPPLPPPAALPPPPPPAAPPTPSGIVAWTAAASSVPAVKARLRRSLESYESDVPDEDADEPGPPGAEESGEESPAAEPPPVQHEPFWLVAIDELRTNRMIQAGIVVLIAVVFVVARAPWKENGVRLSRVLANAAAMDGQEVDVSGRVGDVFQIGGGHAFYLHDGRDSIVVYTKSFRPEKNSRVRLHGSVSTGMLDGAPRVAIFEVPPPPTGS